MHIFRWDLDRTYLDTDIHSVRGMVRSALEGADAKRAVAGAPALIRGLTAHDTHNRIAILSGSPTQMRRVLEAKLAIDGVHFHSLVLKDNLGNLRRGRLRAVRGQVGYKLPQLLAMRLGQPAHVSESLFGDDAEVDALIYTLYADILAGRVSEAEVGAVMRHAGSYRDQIEHAQRSMRRVALADAVEDIFIRVDRGIPLRAFDHLGGSVQVVFSWLQAALRSVDRRRLAPERAAGVIEACMAEQGLSIQATLGLAQDGIRRQVHTPEAALSAFARSATLRPHTEALAAAVAALGGWRRPKPPPHHRAYLAFFDEAERTPPP